MRRSTLRGDALYAMARGGPRSRVERRDTGTAGDTRREHALDGRALEQRRAPIVGRPVGVRGRLLLAQHAMLATCPLDARIADVDEQQRHGVTARKLTSPE